MAKKSGKSKSKKHAPKRKAAKAGKRSSKRRGTRVRFSGTIKAIGGRVYKADGLEMDAIDFMDSAKGRAAKRAKRAAAAKPAKRKAAKRKVSGETKRRHAEAKAAATWAQKRAAKPGRLTPHQLCVRKTMRLNPSMPFDEASEFCKDTLRATAQATAAAAAVPPMDSQQQYERTCKSEFKSRLGSSLEQLEAKYCKEGWSRAKIRKTLEGIKTSLPKAG